MKYIREHECYHNSELGQVHVVVSETSTNYYVWAKPVNYELPIIPNCKVPKRVEKDWLRAYHVAFNEWVEINKNLQKF